MRVALKVGLREGHGDRVPERDCGLVGGVHLREAAGAGRIGGRADVAEVDGCLDFYGAETSEVEKVLDEACRRWKGKGQRMRVDWDED